MQPLKKKKKKCPLLSHSNLELYVLHTYIRLCGTVHLLEFDQKHTHKKKEPMKKTYEPQRKEKKKKKEKKVIKFFFKRERSEVIGLHATEVRKRERKKQKKTHSI